MEVSIDTSAVKAGSKNAPIIQIPVRVANATGWSVDDLELYAFEEDLTTSTGLNINWSSPDTIMLAQSQDIPNARLWSYAPGTVANDTQTFPRRWIHVSIHKDVSVFTGKVQLRAVPIAGQVPASPPNFSPPDLFANMDPEWAAPSDVIGILFKNDTPVSEREAAINALSGDVIGGLAYEGSEIEGTYYVRVPSLGVEATLLPAIDSLLARPQVLSADLVVQIPPTYRTPSDGPNWTTWRILPTSLDLTLTTWHLQAMNLPLAWGCTTGSEGTRVGVIDDGFHNIADLQPNLRPSPVPTDVSNHGTLMASVLGARGNNGTGITGVMWKAGIRQYHATTNLTIAHRILDAVRYRDRVVNLSRGMDATSDPAFDQARAELIVGSIMRRIRSADGPLPLIVISSGRTGGTDASRAALPLLRDSLPNNVLVVTGASRNVFSSQGDVPILDMNGPAPGGRLVDVSAPGEYITSLDANGLPTLIAGTSPAAALVAGVAGLLASFDTALTPGQLKEIIVQSGMNSGRVATGMSDSYPYVDAYGALKLAAARNNAAPLCGTRLVTVDGGVWAERESGWYPTLTHDGTVFGINPFHGGRTIDLHGPASNHRFTLQGSGWTPGAYSAPELAGLVNGGAYNSSIGRSHDGDTIAEVAIRPIRGAATIIPLGDSVMEFNVYIRGSSEPLIRDTMMTIPFAPVTYTDVCLKYIQRSTGDEYCEGGWGRRYKSGGEQIARVSTTWVNGSSKIFTAISFSQFSLAVSDPYDCGSDTFATRTCRDAVATVESRRSELWTIDRATREWERIMSVPYHVLGQTISEDGMELVQTRATVWQTSPSFTSSGCRVDFLSLAAGNLISTKGIESSCSIVGTISP